MFFLSVCVLFYLWRSLASVSSVARYHISGGLGQVFSSQYVDVHIFCLRPHCLWPLVGSLILSCDLVLTAPGLLFDSCPRMPMSSSSWPSLGSPLPRGLSDGAPVPREILVLVFVLLRSVFYLLCLSHEPRVGPSLPLSLPSSPRWLPATSKNPLGQKKRWLVIHPRVMCRFLMPVW
jgi:hypothetical protein